MLERRCALIDGNFTTYKSDDAVESGTQNVLENVPRGLLPGGAEGHLYGRHSPITFAAWNHGPYPHGATLQLWTAPKILCVLRGAMRLTDGFDNDVSVAAPSTVLVHCGPGGSLIRRWQSDDALVVELHIRPCVPLHIPAQTPETPCIVTTSGSQWVSVVPQCVATRIFCGDENAAISFQSDDVATDTMEIFVMIEGAVEIFDEVNREREKMFPGSQLVLLSGAPIWRGIGTFRGLQLRLSPMDAELQRRAEAAADSCEPSQPSRLRQDYNHGKLMMPMLVCNRDGS